ncbi:MAG: nuclear transport factor 2 family protein [Deltaproteobacteria bacterium]|nr:nuclear transport factor 2 family protein [Deltaproteobacteria bacterium]
MHPNAALLERFYQAFSRRDGEAMARCYAPDATFTDPVFQDLRGEEVGAMWRMLCKRAKDLELTWRDVTGDDTRGGASWEARYTFSGTGRRVHNVITARFVFRDGLIIEHRDVFDLWRWTRMALGPVGVVLGWSSLVQGKLRRTARAGLDAWMAEDRRR